ncbi:MAG: M48 family metallopeptidase [Vicinamibacterales bacterium]
MQLHLPWPARRSQAEPAAARQLLIAGESIPVTIARHRRARRYVLRVAPDGTLRLTVPRSGSIAGGLQFAGKQTEWIVRERQRQEDRAQPWREGTTLWFRGEHVTVALDGTVAVLGPERVVVSDVATGVRESIEARLRILAARELPPRCLELAATRRMTVARVAVRNHRSRWGACSLRGVITLNWRLVQMSASVVDYIIWHELTHLEHPNHSPKFWRAVAAVCPGWRDAERWLRRHGREVL